MNESTLLNQIKEQKGNIVVAAPSSDYEINQRYQLAKKLEKEGKISISFIEADEHCFTLKATIIE